MELRGQQPQALEAIRRWYENPTPVFRLDGSAGVGKTTVAIKFSEFARCHYMTRINYHLPMVKGHFSRNSSRTL